MAMQLINVRFWFPDAYTLPTGEALRFVDVETPVMPRENEVVTFDDLRPDDVFRVVSVWWSISSAMELGREGLTGRVTEVAAHLELDAELTEALKDVEEGETGPRLPANVISLSGKLNR